MEKYHKFNKYKVGKYYKYKFSPDNVVFRIEKIIHRTYDSLELSVFWLGSSFQQEITINDENINSYEECD